MTTTIRTQVGILGAGPAGLLLAHLLQKAGIDSVVIDGKSRDEIEGTVKAGIVESPAARVLAESGVSDRIYREGAKHDGIEFHVDGNAHRFDFQDLVQKSVYLYPQHEVLTDLIAARIRDGVPPLFGHLAESVQDAETTRPRIVGTTTEGEAFEISADVVVGADGSGSIARIPVCGSQRNGHYREYPFAWYGVLAEAPPSSDELIYSRSEQGFVLISTRDKNVQRMYFQCDPLLDASTVSDAEIWDTLQAGVSGTTLKQGPIIRKDVLRFRSFVAHELRKGRVFLMGDAAHTVPPTGAKGMNLAFSDVLWLNQALRSFFATGSEALMDAYPENALQRIWKAQHFSYWMTSMLHIAPDATEFDKLRSLGELASVTGSRSAQAYLAENYVGLDYGVGDWD
ncbi:4-hydroxybenzoate 3-monooxygenase [Leifsonia kafniensis]|uniref:4-hydroxybenzoate 3-monooxygenase n=1 Tax=Leifsonia kafniensis TaxID=475957 RepID=A0ABP7KS49_9MICO